MTNGRFWMMSRIFFRIMIEFRYRMIVITHLAPAPITGRTPETGRPTSGHRIKIPVTWKQNLLTFFVTHSPSSRIQITRLTLNRYFLSCCDTRNTELQWQTVKKRDHRTDLCLI